MEASPSIWRRLWDRFLTTWPLFAAGAVTAVFGLWVYGLATEQVLTSNGLLVTRWEQFISGEPNTMGDTLAGFIGSLTLIWVVASVIQQSMELRAQRREFAEMVVAQSAQVEALKAQTLLIQDERQERAEHLRSLELEQMLASLANICDLASNYTFYDFLKAEDDYSALALEDGQIDESPQVDRFQLFQVSNSINIDDRVYKYAKSVFALRIFLIEGNAAERIIERKDRGFLDEVVDSICQIEEFAAKSGRTIKLRVNSLFIPQMRESLKLILDLNIWKSDCEETEEAKK